MKIRASIFLVTGGALALALFVVLHHWNHQAKVSPEIVQRNPNISTVASAIPPALTGSASQKANVSMPSVAPMSSSPQSKEQKEQETLSEYNDVPIDFYGKLEDQFGKPVAQAAVAGSIRVINGNAQTTTWLKTISDANGMFEFHGKGQDISAVPTKPGYALASRAGGGKYSLLYSDDERAHPDPNSPVIIKMWKLQGAEPLISIDQRYKIPYTSEPINFDLITGNVVPQGGDVSIRVNRSAGTISGRSPQDWGLRIEAVGGGLMDSQGAEAITYAAPDSGYQPSEAVTMSTASNTWYQVFHQGLFLSSRNGQIYGQINISFHINSEPNDMMTIIFKGVANTNSSRNLEGNPNTLKDSGQ